MKKITISIILVCISFLVILGAYITYNIFEYDVRHYFASKKIEKANFCETKNDCALAGSQCSFGCYIYVNKSKKEEVSSLINNFKTECIYDCAKNIGVECKQNKCESITTYSSEKNIEEGKGNQQKGKIVQGLQLEADSENPTWSIMINDNMLVYDSPENEPKKGKDFDVITRQDGNTIYFEGKMDNETISGTFKKQNCMSKGKDLTYFVSIDYNSKKLTACGESFGDEI